MRRINQHHGDRAYTATQNCNPRTAHRAFTPTEGEVERARELLAAAEKGAATGQGAVALADGRFVDAAVIRQASRVIALGD